MTTSRRTFVAQIIALMCAWLLPKNAGRAAYVPTGYLAGYDERSRDVEYLTLDGERLDPAYVLEADDTAGWVSVAEKRGLGFVRRTGVVRYYWKAA